MHIVKDIYKIQPLQIDTVELVPHSSIQGKIGTKVSVVGTTLANKVVLATNTLPLIEGNYEIVVTSAGKYKVVNTDSAFESAEIAASATPQNGLVSGLTITVADLTGEAVGNKIAFQVIGDQTYIIPGTVVGKIKSGVHTGKWRPCLLYTSEAETV